ncbi:MAG: hypothetical protein ACLP53_11575 [Isosphaeraceae bacterium]
MCSVRRKRSDALNRRLRRGALLTLLAVGSQSGCTREFYRDWANQDASEAVFEKSRDPRWRLDAFSIEPPAMSRFADPYDPEFPPAPPDDPTSEALSPVPQWPDHRLIVPAEGTGYIDMMEGWMREREAAIAKGEISSLIYATPGNGGRNGTPQPFSPPKPPLTPSPFAPGTGSPSSPPAGAGGSSSPAAAPAPAGPPPAGGAAPAAGGPTARTSPRNPGGNSGTDPKGSSPILLANARSGEKKTNIPPPRPASSFKSLETSRAKRVKDGSVQRAARQAAPPQDPAAPTQAGQGAQRTQISPGSEGLPQSPFVPLDSKAHEDQMSEETRREINRIIPGGPAGGTITPEQAAELSSVLIPKLPKFNVAAAVGLPRNANPYVITLQQAFTLALINARVYQLQLENLYNAALTVALQRFQFEPQFYAGMSPLTSPNSAGFPLVSPLNPINQFLYQTRSAPGGQISSLSLGEVAGVGKLLNSGGQLLMGFANQVVFNFVGKNPIQPTVQSSLPLTFMQPFLRGAGRAVVLENLTQAERSLLYQVRIFAQFRQQFIVDMLTGGTISQPGVGFNLVGFSTAGNTDPTVGFIPLAENVAEVIVDLRNLAFFEQLAALYEQLIEGESSGLSQLQVDQVKSRVLTSRQTLITDIITLRNTNDQFKQQIGLPPDTPMVPDVSLFQPYLDVFAEIDEWQRRKDRKLEDVPKIVDKIPQLPDIVLDGHSLLGPYLKSTTYLDNEEELEATLQAAVRIALEYRLDLMNTRAQLYDAWRQIRVKANALKGVFNVALTNQVFTPPTTTNPFGFFSQAHQFSLVFNAELPLIRVAERNAFREAIIAYEQQRRALMSEEDFIKNQLRGDIRGMQVNYINYDITKRNLVLNIRLKDQAFEQIIAPPQTATGQGLAQSANAATQTTNLINFQNTLFTSEVALITAYETYQLARLTVYRDIGILPYDEWEAFSELFPTEYRGPSLGPGTGNTGKPASAAAAEPPRGVSR